MTDRPRLLVLGTLLVAAISMLGAVADGPGSDARRIMERSNLAYHYAGSDARYRMTLEMGFQQEPKRLRVMTVLRWNEAPGGDQKYLLYFHKPGDVRRMSCMTWKHVGAPDERWIFAPALGGILQVRAPERSSFLGSELVREEFSGRDVDADRHRLVRTERLRGRDCYVVESVPREIEDFTRSTSWIDQATFLPLRQEFWNARGERSRVFVGERIAEIPSGGERGRKYPTLTESSMTTAAGRWTKVSLDSVAYDTGLRGTDFSQRHLQTPLGEWLP